MILIDFQRSAEELSGIIYDHHRRRALQYQTVELDWRKDELVRDVADQATKGYLKDFFDDIWHNFMYMIWSKLIELAEHEEENKCRCCGNSWMDIG